MLEGVPYAVHRFVPHVAADAAAGRHVWETLAGTPGIIHRLPITDDAPDGLFTRFGRDLPAAWQAHLAYNLAELTPADRLIALGVYPVEEQPRLRELIRRLAATPMEFGLNHGDLAPRNVLLRPDGGLGADRLGLAACGPVPYTDLLILLRDHEQNGDPDTDDLAAFADGYGLDLATLRPSLDAIRTLTTLDLVRWGLDRLRDLLSGLVDQASRELVRTSGS